MIKNFSIFKQDNKGDDKKPTHTISTKVSEEFVTIGCCWTKDSTNGKYLSCKLQDVYKDKPGFEIQQELSIETTVTGTPPVKMSKATSSNDIDYPVNNIRPEDVPF